jgi:hypothetical protein
MAKITIPDVSGGYNQTTDINTRLQQLEDELNNKVLYRDNPVGQANEVSQDIDMNGQDIVNAKDVQLLNNGVAYSVSSIIPTVTALAASAQSSANDASLSEAASAQSEANAANSEAIALASEVVVLDGVTRMEQSVGYNLADYLDYGLVTEAIVDEDDYGSI